MQKLIALIALGAIAAVAGCSDATQTVNSDATPAKLQQSTAAFFKTSPSKVSVSDFRRGLTGTAYTAKVGHGVYDCHYIRGAITCDVKRSTQVKKDPWAL